MPRPLLASVHCCLAHDVYSYLWSLAIYEKIGIMGKRKKPITWSAVYEQQRFLKSCANTGPKNWRGTVALSLAGAPAKWTQGHWQSQKEAARLNDFSHGLSGRTSSPSIHSTQDVGNLAKTCHAHDISVLSWNAGNLSRPGMNVLTGARQESRIGQYLGGLSTSK